MDQQSISEVGEKMSKNPEAKITVKMLNEQFKKGAQELSEESKTLSKNFKLQSEQMKLTASDTEKLEARLEFLKQKQDNARKSVENAQGSYDKAVEVFGKNSKAAEDLEKKLTDAKIEEQKFANEVELASRKLKDQQTESEKSGKKLDELKQKAEDTGKKMKDMGESAKDIGGKMTAGISAPIAAMGGMALKTASDFEGAGARLRTQLGLTEDQSRDLEESAKNLWRNGFGASVSEAGDAISIIYQQLGNLPSEEIESVAESAFMLADAFGVDVQDSTRAAQQLMQQFGTDSTSAMDMITVAFQRGGDYSGELLDTVTEYAPQFANMGFSAEQMMGMFASGAESGIWSLDKLGDAVKESFLQITDGADNTRDALGDLGLDYKQIESDMAAGGEKANGAFMAVMGAISGVTDEAERNRLAVELMGTPIEDLGPQYQAFFAQAGEGMTGFEGAAKNASDELYDTFGARLTTTMRSLQESLIPVGEKLLDVAERILPILVEWVSKVVNWFSGLSPVMQNVTLIIGAISMALGPLIVAFGFVMSAIGSMIPVFAKLLPLVSKLGPIFTGIRTALALLTGPIGIAIAIITLLGIIIYKNWDTIKAKTIEIFSAISVFFTAVWASMKAGFVSFVSSAAAKFGEFRSKVQAIFSAAAAIMSNVISSARAAVISIIVNLVSEGVSRFNTLKSRIQSIFEGIRSVASSIFGRIKSAITNPIETAKSTVLGIIDKIKNAFTNMKITIPKPKIPKVSVSMGTKKFMGADVPVPKFDITWFKTGGVFNKKAILGNAGFGDVAEAIVPFQGSHADRIAELIAVAQNRLANARTPEVIVLEGNVSIDDHVLGKVMFKKIEENMQINDDIIDLMGGGRA